MKKALFPFVLLTFIICSTFGSLLTKVHGTPKHLVRNSQTFKGLTEYPKGPQNQFKYYQRNFGTAAKMNFHLWYDSPVVAHFDTPRGRVQIDKLDWSFGYEEKLPRFEVRYRDSSKRLKLSVLAIPKLKVGTNHPDVGVTFTLELKNRLKLMDKIICSRIPGDAEVYDWILINRLTFNGVDCGKYLIKIRNGDEKELDWNSIEEMILSSKIGKEHWNEL
jgi:hypothetical protein